CSMPHLLAWPSRAPMSVLGKLSAASSLLIVAGCSMFGGDDGSAARQLPQAANPDCDRLAPLVVNPDGTLAKGELEVGLKVEFKKWDKDGNGSLSQAELQPLNDSLRALSMSASPVMDWNGDGRVTFDEFASGWRTMFELCGDGNVVTKAEMARDQSDLSAHPS